jgi:hypothetical protein
VTASSFQNNNKDTNTDSPHFEESFSEDGGKTWEVNWIRDQPLVKDEAEKLH